MVPPSGLWRRVVNLMVLLHGVQVLDVIQFLAFDVHRETHLSTLLVVPEWLEGLML